MLFPQVLPTDELHLNNKAGVRSFSRNLQTVSTTEVSDVCIKGVHNLNLGIAVCCSTQNLVIIWVCLSPHPELQVTSIAGDTWNAELQCILEDVLIEINEYCYGKN
jgi:hypothetical protein